MTKTIIGSFSGGRTSGFKCKWLLDSKSDEYNLVFAFANTGLEHEKTLDFVNECDKRWGLNLVWLEAVVHHGERKGTGYKVVTYETASRNGEPFEEVIKKYGIANKDYPHCNREMKLAPLNAWKRDNYPNALYSVGIRVDEIDRMAADADEKGIIYPLISMKPTTKEEIRHWWKQQEFDLGIPEHMGNCMTCWKKSDRKLMTIAKHEPERFEFMRRMEKEHSLSGAQMFDESGNPKPRRWFRKYRTVDDIIASSKQPFVEFVDHMPEWQLDMFNMDASNGCSESCEVYSDD